MQWYDYISFVGLYSADLSTKTRHFMFKWISSYSHSDFDRSHLDGSKCSRMDLSALMVLSHMWWLPMTWTLTHPWTITNTDFWTLCWQVWMVLFLFRLKGHAVHYFQKQSAIWTCQTTAQVHFVSDGLKWAQALRIQQSFRHLVFALHLVLRLFGFYWPV